MDEEERNYCCLILLLSRVGLKNLRTFFINTWNLAGGFVPWTDCPKNGVDLLTKYTPLSYEKDKVKSGDSNSWDLSLFVKALINSKPPFVPKSNKVLVDGLTCLKDTRNKLCHTGSGKIETAEFTKLYTDACNALLLIGATPKDFKQVEEDVQQPWSEVLSLLKRCTSQDADILNGMDTINNRLDQLQKGMDKVLKGIENLQKQPESKSLSIEVTVITSRPGEANKMDEKLHFDRCVETTGFSEKQVIQYVEKYFNSKSEEVKNMAVEKVKGTAHYMTFGRVPLMCFLMCMFIEYEIQHNFSRDNLVSLTIAQFYCEVITCLIRNDSEISRLDKESASSVVEKTLDNFAELAAQLHEQNRFTFTQNDVENLKLPENEITYLRNSSLITCYPIASDSPFPQTTLEYGFAHLTIQEFFVARHLVKTNAMAAQESSEMVLRFTSGLLGLDKQNNNDELMSRVVECVCKQEENESRRRLVLLRCLYEYGQEKEFTRQQLSTNPDYRYWNRNGMIELYDVTDTDCDAIAMLVNTATSMASPPHHVLFITFSLLTRTGLNTLLPSLVHTNCTITALWLGLCGLDDEAVECLTQHLPNSKITKLYLGHNKITDTGSQHIVSHLPSKITELHLLGNPVSDEYKKSVKQFCKANYPGLELDI